VAAQALPAVPAPSPTSAAPGLPLVHELPIAAHRIAFSPDDRLLALATIDYQVLVYDTQTWELKWRASHADMIDGLGFSPDGRLVASASLDGTVRAWDAATGAPRDELDYDSWATGPDFSADSLFMASGGASGKAVVTQLNEFTLVGEYMNELPVDAVAISPAGPWLALMTAGSWGPVELAVWDIHTHERRTLARQDGPPNASNPAFSPDTQWLAAALKPDDPIHIWQTQTWPEAAQLARPSGWVQKLEFSPDGRRLGAAIFAGVPDSVVSLWDVPTWQPGAQIRPGDVVLDFAFSPDGALLATVHGQGEPPQPPLNEGRLWDAVSGALLARMPHDGQVQGLAFSHDGRRVATGGIDGATRIWTLEGVELPPLSP
jgi:WD40 repeat protein